MHYKKRVDETRVCIILYRLLTVDPGGLISPVYKKCLKNKNTLKSRFYVQKNMNRFFTFDTDFILTFSLGLSVPTRRFRRLRTTI